MPDEKSVQVALIRDIFGNPFRPVSLDPAWLTSDVLALARGIYAERAFGRLPLEARLSDDIGVASADLIYRVNDEKKEHAEHFTLEGWRIEVIDMDGNRIDKMLFIPPEKAQKTEAAPAQSGK